MKPRLITSEEQIEWIDWAVEQGAFIQKIETCSGGAVITLHLRDETREWGCGFEAADHAIKIMKNYL